MEITYEKSPQFCSACKAIGHGDDDYNRLNMVSRFTMRRMGEAVGIDDGRRRF